MKAPPHGVRSVLVLVGILACLYGLTGLKTNADYRVYFDKSDPLLQIDNAVAAQYAELDGLILILSAEKKTLLEPGLIEFYPRFEQRLLQVAYVERVTGFFQHLDEGAASNLITADGRIGMLNIAVALPRQNTAREVKQFMQAIESVVDDSFRLKQLSVSVNYSGTLALNEAYIDVVRHDLKRFVPLLLLIFTICLFSFFRSWRTTALLIGIALLSAVSAFGVAGWMRWELAAINAFTPIIIMSLNIATSMHLVVNYYRFVAEGDAAAAAMSKSMRYNFQALTCSKLTTAAGFLLLTFSPSPPINIVGYTVAIGMLVSYILCLTWLRALLPKIPLSREQAGRVVARSSLTRLGVAALQQGNRILVVFFTLLLIGLIALQQLTINDNVYEYFPEDHRFRQGTQLIDTHLGGSIRLLYSVDSGKAHGVLEPEFIARLATFTSWLAGQKNVTRVDEALSAAVEKAAGLGDIRTLLENTTPEMFGLQQAITQDYRAVKVSVFLNTVSARELIVLDRFVRGWLDRNMAAYQYQGGVGPDILFARLGERNAKSMFFSLVLALVMIALITGLLLRSWSATVIGVVCNLFPVIVVFAAWSLAGGYISLGSAMVMGMIMGVIVDDTLHMLLKFPHETDAPDVGPIMMLYEKVCPAIVITSITLAAGLFVGVFSGFRPIFELSLLSLSIILVAMLADLLLLPALMQVMKFKRANP
jgi:uncharacterized protein